MARQIVVELVGDTSKFDKSMGAATGRVTGFQSSFKQSVLSGVGLGAGIGAFNLLEKGIGAVVGAFGDAVTSLLRIEKINAQTASAIKSTGAAAGVTAEQVEAYAGGLEKATGIEAESIQEGQNLLLTFKNIKNGVGESNQIFDRTTEAMVDMSVAMGTDAKSGAIQLGKALNDPIKGIAALSRVGVTFTSDQEKMIREMVAAGDVMGAQKLILGELESQFGGSAEAFGNTTAGKFAKAGNFIGDIFEGVVVGAVELAESVADAAETAAESFNNFSLDFGDMGTRIHAISDQAKVDFQEVKDFIRIQMDDLGLSFEDAALAADEHFHTITRSTDKLVEESGAAWETYQNQIRVTGENVSGEVRGFQGTIIEAMDEGRIKVVEIAFRTPGEIAGALRDGRDAVSQAATALALDIENAIDPVDEIAQLQGQLTGDQLAAGMASKDPIVRNQARALYAAVQERLTQLGAYSWGSNIAQAWANGMASQWGYAHSKAVYLGTATSGPLKGYSPPKEGPLKDIDKWGENIGQAWSGGLGKGANLGLNLLTDNAQGATASTGNGGGVTINIESFIGSDRDIDQFADRLAMRLRLQGV